MNMNKGVLSEILNRRSLRSIGSRELDNDMVDRLIAAAGLAPSCFNRQPWRYLLVQSPEGREKLTGCLSEKNALWAAEAPLFILVATSNELDCQLGDGRKYAEFDTGMSVFSLLIQAEKEGIIAHPMAGYNQEKIKNEFGIPEDISVVTVIAAGYYDISAEAKLSTDQAQTEKAERIRDPEEKWICRETWSF